MRQIYLVTVYCDDGRIENYPFAEYSDALESIRITYSRAPSAPRLESDATPGILRVIDRDTLKLLIYCRPMRILDGSTHL